MSHRRPAERRRRDRVLLVLASLVGVWLGATAPSVSPVTPAPPPAVTAAAP